jgi:hypothetical protein
MLAVNPCWEGLGELAAQTGHGGGDFWTLYHFAREILTGEKGPFDIYGGCDVTIPGIQALRSSMEGGKPMEVPDFRKKADRNRYRNDDWQQERYDTRAGVFGGFVPDAGDTAANFSTTMKGMVTFAPVYRAYADWRKVRSALREPAAFLPIAQRLLDGYGQLVAAYKDAHAIVDAYPESDGAQVLRAMLDVGEETTVLSPGFLPALKKEVAALRRRFGEETATLTITASPLLAGKARIAAATYPDKRLKFTPVQRTGDFEDIRPRYEGTPKEGLLYARITFTAKQAGAGTLRIGADGPFKVFVNRREAVCNPKATNPISAQVMTLDVTWKAGENEIMLAMRTNKGLAWGFIVSVPTPRLVRPGASSRLHGIWVVE